KDPRIAGIVVEAIRHGAEVLNHYLLHAWVVMPNHVHILITPKVPIPILMKSLKSITAKRANEILGQTGNPFWQEESFDRNVRDRDEFFRIRNYIEMNPVRAGLVCAPDQYDSSSAAGRIGGSPADQGVRLPWSGKILKVSAALAS